MADKDVLGRAGEDRAVRHLEQSGWVVLDRNWRGPSDQRGELDIIAHADGCVVAVEVKTRRALGYGHPFEAITALKVLRLQRLLRAWRAAHPDLARGRELRIDAIAIVGADPATGALEHLRDVRGW